MNPFSLIAELAEALGDTPVSQFEGCWERKIDDTWAISVNAHRQPMYDSAGVEVPPFCASVAYNGWPAGIIHPVSGGVFAAGEGANIETFCSALRAAIEAAKEAE